MNILYLTNHLNIGGITSYVLTLARGLKERGHNIYIASSGGGLLPEFQKAGITYWPIPIMTKKELNPKLLACRLKLSTYLKCQKIDIIHSNTRTTQVLASLLSRKTGIAHISTCHGFFKRRLLRRVFPCWGLVTIAISEQVREHLIHDLKVAKDKIKVIHNGIDVERFAGGGAMLAARCSILDACHKGEQETSGGPVVGIVARLSDVKGHIYLLEAMRKVIASIPRATLLIVGDGKEKDNLLALSVSLEIQKRVFFLPEVSDTREVLSGMDVFVMPSLNEGLGLALMEAMAFGLPVIGSDVGGIRSLIKDGETGLLVRPADSPALGFAILELLNDKKKMADLGRRAAAFIAKNFSQDKMVSRTEGVYAQCLKDQTVS
jgi:glycosyltransferase involved in cell wall biosynthesis